MLRVRLSRLRPFTDIINLGVGSGSQGWSYPVGERARQGGVTGEGRTTGPRAGGEDACGRGEHSMAEIRNEWLSAC